MKRLEDIEKKQYFEVPERYFEALPLKIQERVSASKKTYRWFQAPAFRYALPVAAMLVIGFFWLKPNAASIEDQLSAIHESELVAYLNDSDLNSEDLESAFILDDDDLNSLEEKVISSFETSDEVLETLIEDFKIETDSF